MEISAQSSPARALPVNDDPWTRLLQEWLTPQWASLRRLARRPLFQFGLLIRLALVVMAVPKVQEKWFVPFLLDSMREPSIDPWTAFLRNGGDSMSFPYGPVMYLLHLPGVLIGGWIDQHFGLNFFALLGFGLTILLFDVELLLALEQILGGNEDDLLRYYWLSPIVLYICYWHGQTDMVPVLLLTLSLRMLQRLRPRAAGLALGLAVAAKLSMMLPVPFLVIYLYRSKRLAGFVWQFTVPAVLTAALLQGPYLLFSPGVKTMVLGSPEIQKVYQLSINFNDKLHIYVLPFTYLLLLYAAWRIGRMSFELLFSFLGAAFFLVLLLTPASIGWFLWAVPFLVAHQLGAGFSASLLVYGYSMAMIGFHLGQSSGAMIRFGGPNLSVPLSLPPHLQSLWLTGMAAAGAALAARMFRTGVQQNDYFRLSREPVAIGIAGDSGSGKDTLAAALAGVFGARSVASISGDDYHSWDRHAPMWRAMTHLNPQANNLLAFSNDVLALMEGKDIVCRHYDHKSGRFTKRHSVERNDVIVVSGLHTLYIPTLLSKFDVRVFLAMDEELRRYFKLRRDVNERGHPEQKVVESLEHRYPDAKRFIHPQANAAHLVFTLEPVNREDLSRPGRPGEIRLRMCARMRRGLYYESLTRVLVSLCGLHVDMSMGEEGGGVELRIEGDVEAEDLSLAAVKLVPHLEELMAIDAQWEGGMIGLMQLISLVEVAEALRARGASEKG